MAQTDHPITTNAERPAREARTIVLPIDEVRRRVGLSRSKIYELVRAGEFPRQVPLTANRVGWLEHEVENWIAGRVRSRSEHGR